jgi:PD-(D/E)XK nuclease superfamily
VVNTIFNQDELCTDFSDLGSIDLLDIANTDATEDWQERHPLFFFNPNPLHQLSNSTLSTKHTCARKFQIQKLTQPDRVKYAYLEFGTVLGIGIQLATAGMAEQDIIFEMMKAWKMQLDDDSRAKQRQTFWHAVHAVLLFNRQIKDSIFGADWELAIIDGKPAIELGFRIALPNGFYYRGYIDLILQNKKTGEIMVVEAKNSSLKYSNEAQWKNSGQALGYSLVLDYLKPELSSYRLLFLVYLTHNSEFIPYPFVKQSSQRARWLESLITECEDVARWEQKDTFPMYGDACFKYSKPCEFFDTCEFSDRALFNAGRIAQLEKGISDERYDFEINFHDIVIRQLERLEG